MTKALTKSLFLCIFALATPVLADFTQAESDTAKAHCKGAFIEGEGYGEKYEEAIDKAQSDIAKKITSLVNSKRQMRDFSGNGEDDVLKEFSIYLDTNELESKDVPIIGFNKIGSERLESGEIVLKGYVCRLTEARAWLHSLDSSVNAYSIKADEIYKATNKTELKKAAASIRDRANKAARILISITEGDMPADMSKDYSKLMKELKDAKDKINKDFDTNYGPSDYWGIYPMSILLPGSVHYFKGQTLETILFFGGEGFLIWSWVKNYEDQRDARRKRNDAVLKANSTTNLNEINEWLQMSKGYESDRESAEKGVFWFRIFAFGFWGLNTWYALSSEPREKREHKSRNVSILPIPSQNGIGVAFNLTGNF